MDFQTNFLYEIEVGIHNLGSGMTAQHTDEEGDDTLYAVILMATTMDSRI